MSKKLLIVTGPQGSGNHLFARLLSAHPMVKGWDSLKDNYWVPSDEEPFARYWVYPDELEFPEGYMRNEILIINGTLDEFLMSLLKNLGRDEITTAS